MLDHKKDTCKMKVMGVVEDHRTKDGHIQVADGVVSNGNNNYDTNNTEQWRWKKQ